VAKRLGSEGANVLVLVLERGDQCRNGIRISCAAKAAGSRLANPRVAGTQSADQRGSRTALAGLGEATDGSIGHLFVEITCGFDEQVDRRVRANRAEKARGVRPGVR